MTADAINRQSAAAWLASVQRPDGSWGYRTGGSSYVEPTVLAALALARSPSRSDGHSTVERALAWLLAAQRPDGSWGTGADTDPRSWATGYAVIALARLGETAPNVGVPAAAGRGLDALLATPTLVVSEAEVALSRVTMGIDGRLAGWAWRSGDASFVFPTSLAIIAASTLGGADHPRVRQGLSYLLDRACANGGWNIGSPLNFMQPVDPDPVHTAVGLLALKSAGEGASPAASLATRSLGELASRSTTALSLAWASLALRALGHSAGDPLARLARLQAPDGDWRGDVVATSLALLATASEPIGL